MHPRPAFDPPLRLTEPTLPSLAALAPDLEAMWAARRLSNDGPFCGALGEAIAARLGVPSAVMTASGTAGLMAVLRALGVRGEVVVPAFTFSATAQAVVWAGGRPVFADVDPDTGALTAATCEARIGPRTEAIVAVHLFGRPCPPEPLEALARRRGLALVFDAAHAFGSRYADGRPVGVAGDAEVFSFHATKLLAAGEGGAVATRWPDIAERCDQVIRFGHRDDGQIACLGFNGKLQEWNALLALRGLPHVEAWTARRAELVERYRSGLTGLPGLATHPRVPDGGTNHQYFAVRVDPDRLGRTAGQLAAALQADGIDARRYFTPALHQHPAFAASGAPRLPAAEALADSVICLPLYSHLPGEWVDRVCAALERAVAGRGLPAGTDTVVPGAAAAAEGVAMAGDIATAGGSSTVEKEALANVGGIATIDVAAARGRRARRVARVNAPV